MPIYEYRCNECRRRFSRLLLTFSAAADYQPVCPHCHSRSAKRLVSRVYAIRAEGSLESLDEGGGDDILEGLDEKDPRSMARMMRRMSEESGEDLGPEFNEVVNRLEAGQDPEQIEKDLPDLAGESASGVDAEDLG